MIELDIGDCERDRDGNCCLQTGQLDDLLESQFLIASGSKT